jgi:hypothetical protein
MDALTIMDEMQRQRRTKRDHVLVSHAGILTLKTNVHPPYCTLHPTPSPRTRKLTLP